jgi:hypothetical protein
MITDEMVEVAVDGAVKALWSAPDNAPAQATLIRAAIEAVLPMIRDAALEEAAKVAMNRDVGNGYYIEIREAIAEAILALKGGE